jgi:TfoX/Sxy family transcriptional regulator of competence genes
MASDRDQVAFFAEQMAGAGAITYRPMFGEYGLYCDGKVVAFVCDNTLYLKPVPEALALLDDPVLEPIYPGSKDYIRIDAELDEPERLAVLVRVVAAAVPEKKPRRKKG